MYECLCGSVKSYPADIVTVRFTLTSGPARTLADYLVTSCTYVDPVTLNDIPATCSTSLD